jgi:hypothetical protein
MPVRWTIHSSEVSNMRSRSLLERTRSGRYEPQPRTTERRRVKDLIPYTDASAGVCSSISRMVRISS